MNTRPQQSDLTAVLVRGSHPASRSCGAEQWQLPNHVSEDATVVYASVTVDAERHDIVRLERQVGISPHFLDVVSVEGRAIHSAESAVLTAKAIALKYLMSKVKPLRALHNFSRSEHVDDLVLTRPSRTLSTISNRAAGCCHLSLLRASTCVYVRLRASLRECVSLGVIGCQRASAGIGGNLEVRNCSEESK